MKKRGRPARLFAADGDPFQVYSQRKQIEVEALHFHFASGQLREPPHHQVPYGCIKPTPFERQTQHDNHDDNSGKPGGKPSPPPPSSFRLELFRHWFVWLAAGKNSSTFNRDLLSASHCVACSDISCCTSSSRISPRTESSGGTAWPCAFSWAENCSL